MKIKAYLRATQKSWVLGLLVLLMLYAAGAPAQQGHARFEHGVVLSSQELPASHGLQAAGQQYLISYSSIDGTDGTRKRADTAAVFLPKGTPPADGWPVVVWNHGTIGIGQQCAPSLNPRSERDAAYLNIWLALGFAVVAPDYPGLGSAGLHHYLDSRAEAWSSLDSVRAAMGRFPLKNDVTIVGQSQGAHAAFSAGIYQHKYAPELHLRSLVLTGVPYFNLLKEHPERLSMLLKGSNPGDPKIAYYMYMFLASKDLHPNLAASDYFKPSALPVLAQASHLCLFALERAVSQQGLSIDTAIKPRFGEIIRQQLDRMAFFSLQTPAPVFVGIGLKDIDVPTPTQLAFEKTLKQSGIPFKAVHYPGASHSAAMALSPRDVVPFVLAHRPAQAPQQP